MDGTTALPFGTTIELDVLSYIYTFADMLLNGQLVEEGKSHMELCDIAGTWGAPWYQDPTAGNGYPILQWQYERGDYREICGFEENTGIKAMDNGQLTIDNDAVYDLSGRRMSNGKLSRGIYIVNGRKVVR